VKIAFIEFAAKGGMIHYAFQLCRALAREGHEVTLITERSYELEALEHPFRVEPTIELWDPKPSGLSMKWWAVAARKVRRVSRAVRYYAEWLRVIRRVQELQADVVLIGDIRFPFDLFPLALLKRASPVLIDICHNVHPFATSGAAAGLFDRSRWREWFYRRIYRQFDRVFVHFERNRAEFLTSFGIPPEKVGVIVHGNEAIFRDLRAPDVTAATLRTRIGLAPDVPVVLFLGTLSRYKGVDTLIDAFPAIRNATGAQLVVAGFPSPDFDVRAHQQQARERGIEQAVTWVPEYVASEDVAAWMELASVIVFPYRDIYQSGALHIAQTFGVPIVASAIGAMRDVIEDGKSGLLVPPQDPAALAAAIRRLLEDRELASRLGASAAADAEGPFSWSTIAAQILSGVTALTRAPSDK
jgi:glycosyltransferase involved in cell wall biosynthesis